MSEWKKFEGCRPCNFRCSCCSDTIYRCTTGEKGYYKGPESKPTRIICRPCLVGDNVDCPTCMEMSVHAFGYRID